MKNLATRFMLSYLHFWARLVVRARRPIIIGVTGSVGKTTTKEVVASVLMHADARPIVGRVGKTPGNMNNTQGVPLVILGFTDWPASRLETIRAMLVAPFRAVALATVAPYPRMLVLEFAVGPKGNIPRTADLARPTVAIVTAIGPAHLETFGTIDQIVEEKGALVRNVGPSGLVVLGADNPQASALERDARAPVVKVPGRGRALSENAARAVADFFGVPREVVERALADQHALAGRFNVLDLGTMTVIDDCYNANPLSMEYGLDHFAAAAPPGTRRVAILGDMRELGPDSPRYHREIAALARTRVDLVVGVGPLARDYEADYWFGTSDACAMALHGLIRTGDCVFVKGSNAVALPTVVRRVKELAQKAREKTGSAAPVAAPPSDAQPRDPARLVKTPRNQSDTEFCR